MTKSLAKDNPIKLIKKQKRELLLKVRVLLLKTKFNKFQISFRRRGASPNQRQRAGKE